MDQRRLERIVKGFANHRRIQFLDFLRSHAESSLQEIADQTGTGLKTASEHVRRMAIAGLVLKRHDGAWVRHKLTRRGLIILKFLRTLE